MFKFASILRNKNFRMLWFGQSISVLGSRFTNIAMMWFIIQKTGSPMALGVSMVCMVLPSLLLMPFAGVIADKNKKKFILILSNFISGLIMLLVTFVVTRADFSMIALYALVVLASASEAFFQPAYSATIPLIVEEEDLTRANSLSQLTNQLANVLGPALAGILIAIIGEAVLFFVDGLSFLLAAVLTGRLLIPKVTLDTTNKPSFLSDFKEGFYFVLQMKKILYLTIVGGVIINFFLAPLNVYFTVVCSQVFHVGSQGLGVIDSAISIGALLGSAFMLMELIKNKIKLAIVGLVLEGLALLIPGIFGSYVSFIVFAALLGVGISLASVGISTIYQTMIPKEKMGRVGSLSSSLSVCTVPLGTLFGSFMIQHIPITLTLVISGMIVFMSGLSLVIPFRYVYKKGEQKPLAETSL